jgi:methylthioribose-1-phosphate isomerase
VEKGEARDQWQSASRTRKPAQPTRATSQFEAIVGSEEDRFKAAASKIENSAHRAIEEQDRQAREVGEQISQLVISSCSVRDQIAAGSIAPAEPLEVGISDDLDLDEWELVEEGKP